MALIGWLESQEIDIDDAVPVLVVTISGFIETLALKNHTDAAEGARIAGNMIRETVGQMR